jgi:hypothetical protein
MQLVGIEPNPGPINRLLLRVDSTYCYLKLESSNGYYITLDTLSDFIISDSEPANFVADRSILIDLMVLCQRSEYVTPLDIINMIKPKRESPFVNGKKIRKGKSFFYIDAEHNVSTRGREVGVDLGILSIYY